MRKEAKPPKARWRVWVTVAAWSSVFLSSALAARTVRHFAMTDQRFNLTEPELKGVEMGSRWRILQSFAPDQGRSIFHLPLAERRRRLLAIDWIEDASISRIWPNQVVVRIQERKPVAFVVLPEGHRYALIDAQGVLLSPPRRRLNFPVLGGVSEEQTERQRRDRVLAMQRLLADVGPDGAKEISEVNASNTADLRVTTQVQGRVVELWMGDRNFGSRYRGFVNHYAEIRPHSGGKSSFDLRIDGQVIER